MRRFFLVCVGASALLLSSWASAQTVNEIEDRLAIQEVLARYSFAWDFADKEAFTALFTEDAVWEAFEFEGEEPIESYHGRSAIGGFLEARYASNLDVKASHHQSGLMILEISGSMAKTQNMVIITTQRRDQVRPEINSSGFYRDTWVKTEDGWKIAHRALRLDGPVPRRETN